MQIFRYHQGQQCGAQHLHLVFASLQAVMFAALRNVVSVHCVQAHVKHAHAAARDPRLLATASPSIVASRSQTLPASWSDLGEHHPSVPLVVKPLQLCNEVIKHKVCVLISIERVCMTGCNIVMLSVVSSLQRISFWSLASVYDRHTVHVSRCLQQIKMLGVCLS